MLSLAALAQIAAIGMIVHIPVKYGDTHSVRYNITRINILV